MCVSFLRLVTRIGIVSEEIVDETDQYEDNRGKYHAKRLTNAAIMRGSVWIPLRFFSHSHGPQDRRTRMEPEPRCPGRGHSPLDLDAAPGRSAVVYAAHVAQATTAPTADSSAPTAVPRTAIGGPRDGVVASYDPAEIWGGECVAAQEVTGTALQHVYIEWCIHMCVMLFLFPPFSFFSMCERGVEEPLFRGVDRGPSMLCSWCSA